MNAHVLGGLLAAAPALAFWLAYPRRRWAAAVTMRSFAALGIAMMALAVGCGGREPPKPLGPPGPAKAPTAPVLPKGFDELPPHAKAAWLRGEEERPYREAQAAKDRAELVMPAPPGFRPEPVARKLKLTLIAQKAILRKGERLWYRLELQNAGREPVDFVEGESFFKNGTLSIINIMFQFYVTPPGGREGKVKDGAPQVSGGTTFADELRLPGWERMTNAEKDAAVRRLQLSRKFEGTLYLTLAPGETVVTRPWRHVHWTESAERRERGLGPAPPPPGRFRELHADVNFDTPGTYRVRAVFDDPPSSPLSEAYIKRMEAMGESRESTLNFWRRIDAKRLGRTESNIVRIEVVP